MAKLYYRYGAMNCGKTTHLLQTAYNYEELGKRVCLIKPQVDTKGAEEVVSRIGASRKVDELIEEHESVRERLKGYLKVDGKVSCILVDEVQFFGKSQVDELMEIASLDGIPVICYGLRTDFRGEGFEGSTRLLQIAHSIEEQKTMCSCGKKATYNARKVDGVLVFEGEQVCIDDKAKIEYVSMCSGCYLTERKGEKG